MFYVVSNKYFLLQIKLAACSDVNCGCEAFLSAGDVAECFNCLHSAESHQAEMSGIILNR